VCRAAQASREIDKHSQDGYNWRVKELKMKRAFLIIIVLLSATAVFAVNYSTFQSGFNEFAQDLANGAPFNSSIGLGWSQAYIGQFPHFGLGITAGVTTISAGAMQTLADAMGVTLPSSFSYASKYGLPLPGYTIDARIGGFVLPFDIGFKLGYIPPGTFPTVDLNYILFGVDFRYGLLKDQGFSPALSVGLGYSHMKASVGVPGFLGSNVTIAQVNNGSNSYNLSLANPDLGLDWSTNVIEAKAQISKKLIFITPYLGVAAALSFGTSASGSVTSQLYYNGSPITQTDINNITAYYKSQGQNPPDLTTTGFSASAKNGAALAFRAFGGVSFNLFILYLDFGVGYDFSTAALGGSLNARIAI
jgi:hypothetical protein